MAELDRFGEPLVDPIVGEPDPAPDCGCTDGWLGEDDEGRPRPCYECKPSLRPEVRRYRAGITDQKPPEET